MTRTLRTDQALQAYEESGAITTKESLDHALASLVEDYMQHRELRHTDESRIALAHKRKDVHKINQFIRMARQAAGELDNEIRIKTAHGERAFATGDRIVFTKNDQSLSIRNGVLGTVENISSDLLIVKLDDPSSSNATIQIDFRNYSAFDHGYATTIHKSQGITVDQTFVLSSKSLDRHLTYVAMTRHKLDARIYCTSKEPKNIVQTLAHTRTKKRSLH